MQSFKVSFRSDDPLLDRKLEIIKDQSDIRFFKVCKFWYEGGFPEMVGFLRYSFLTDMTPIKAIRVPCDPNIEQQPHLDLPANAHPSAKLPTIKISLDGSGPAVQVKPVDVPHNRRAGHPAAQTRGPVLQHPQLHNAPLGREGTVQALRKDGR